MWGLVPLYFHAVAEVPPWIVLCHRVFWSAIFLALVVTIRKEWKRIWPVLRSGRNIRFLTAGSVLIALNWLIFIYAVASGQTLQASLGYFINPLLSIALGMIFLGERLRRGQWVAVLVAAAAVANLALRGGGIAWIAVSLALSFGFYGLVRKKVDINSLHGLLVETLILLPIALVTLILFDPDKPTPMPYGLLSLSGFVTAVPLLMFGAAVRSLKLSTMGFLQYVGPTLQFLVALLIFHEPLDHSKLLSFALCWLAILVYVIDSVLNRQAQPIVDDP
jgi:chloramphenicol-sensitive protein RarD